MARGDVTQQSLVLQSPFFPRILDMGNIISAWENTGERVEGVSWGVGGTKHLVPPNTTVVAVPWLLASHRVPALLVVLACSGTRHYRHGAI